MVAAQESARLAERLIEATCAKQAITPNQLTIHADRGAPMRSKLVAELFTDLGIAASHSRPRVSNDNPFSEAQFRTFKYRPEFPDRFGSIQDARAICHALFGWYNDAHHHSGLRYLTPAAGTTAAPRRSLRSGIARARRRTRCIPRASSKGRRSSKRFRTPFQRRNDDRHPGRPAAWGDRAAKCHRAGPPYRDRQQRGGASLNTEPGCLKVVDAARTTALWQEERHTAYLGNNSQWWSWLLGRYSAP